MNTTLFKLKHLPYNTNAVMAEWLRRWTWNPMGSSRAGSNPARSDTFLFGGQLFFSNLHVTEQTKIHIRGMTKIMKLVITSVFTQIQARFIIFLEISMISLLVPFEYYQFLWQTLNVHIGFLICKKDYEAPGGVEPSTFCLLGRRSNQLSYRALDDSSKDYGVKLGIYRM